ncbi:hypothetical protein SAMN05421841_3853 [Chryseobacterium wanjuense]|uniref:YD repeat-containing protein n=1 Tax=Chryseobacterium wanjuense TaxID=356305 RepID=A0A1I0S2D9_9FLAO|nr:hypothetical protein [Chryseobacterium wanjuense]SEW48641.1 hypothetical protein SAMN05421841_3853 [Chryseobacterium wanjuense]
MKKRLILVSALLASLLNAQGIQNYQNFGGNFFPQSPNSTPFAVAGKYPINMYRGVPIINVPLFNEEHGESNFTMSLSYNVKSVKPSTVPTWVGLGWNLDIGGSITRIVNGGVDEVYVSGVVPNNRYSYLDNYSTLDNSNWDSQSALQNYYSANLQVILQSEPNVVPNPDEFIVNVGGLTGSFYLNEKGKWIGRTRDGRTLKIEHQYKFDYVLPEKTILGSSYIGTTSHNLKRMLYGFAVTTDDGTKYIFGLDDTAIEFSSNPETVDLSFNPHIVPSAWNIKEIIYPTGKSTKFTYERDERSVFVVNRSGNRSYYSQGSSSGSIGNSASSGNLLALHSNRLNNVFLKKVEGEDFIVNLNRSLANQKEYEQFDVPTNEWVPPYTHHISAYYNFKHWYKLDNVTVTDKAGKIIKNIVFNYNNDPTDRLMLNNVTINTIEKYNFAYNSQKLPKYISDATDHWGYYNGTSFYESNVNLNVPQDQMKNIFLNVYPTYKVPNLNLSKAQTLEQITYPTGGTTTFEYELNDYSKYGDKDINETYLKIYPTSTNEIAGGLRIKKIKSCNENNNCINKTYSYLNDDGITSSGVLPYKPIYLLDGYEPSVNLSFWEFNYNSFQSLKNEDNSIGYSKVTEIDDNGGKKETYYTNLEQTDYKDKSGNRYYGWLSPILFKQLPYLSYSLMRGKPLKEIVYSDTNKISETTYTYTQQTDYLRAYAFNSKQFGQVQAWGPWSNAGGVSYGALLDAHNINFNSSFLSQKKTVFENVESTVQNFYNYTYNTPTSTWKTQSDGTIYVTNYKYASDTNNTAMLNAYMVGVPVGQEIKKNNIVLSKTETVYPTSLPTTQTGNLLLPLSETYFDPQNIAPSTEITYDKYDTDGNVVQFTTKDDVPTTIIWGYSKTQPIAKIEGATYDQVQPYITGILTASENDFMPPAGMTSDQTETAMVEALNIFRKNPALLGYQITTYSYDPVIGVRSITPPSGVKEVYKYDSNSRLERIEDVNGKLLKEFKYNYKP